jgi:hypothetical protein
MLHPSLLNNSKGVRGRAVAAAVSVAAEVVVEQTNMSFAMFLCF